MLNSSVFCKPEFRERACQHLLLWAIPGSHPSVHFSAVFRVIAHLPVCPATLRLVKHFFSARPAAQNATWSTVVVGLLAPTSQVSLPIVRSRRCVMRLRIRVRTWR